MWNLRPSAWILFGIMICVPWTALADEPVSFKNQIAPILLKNCVACHGPKKAESSYRVDSYERAVGEGDSEIPGFVATNLDESESFRRITSDDEDERMPLEADPLPAEQVALIKRWIEEGTKFDGPDPKAPLASIVPPPTHPDPPEVYPQTLPITAMAFRPDGAELYVGGYHEITVWNPADGALLRRIKNVGQRTYALAFSPDGKLLAAAGGAAGRLGEVRLFDPAAGTLVRVLGSTADVVFDIAFSPQGDRLASCGADNAIRIFNVADGAEQLVIESHSDWVMAVAFSPDGSQIASASRDKTAKVFDAKTGSPLITYSEHAQPVRGVMFHPDGKQVLTSGEDRRIRQWNIADGKKTAEIGGFGGQIYKLTTGGDFLFAPSSDKQVRQIEIKTRKVVRAYAGHQDWALVSAFHPATARLATGSFDGEVRIWNTADGKEIVKFMALPGYQEPEKK